jgi:ABC-type amino acid transport substrate-binding protein
VERLPSRRALLGAAALTLIFPRSARADLPMPESPTLRRIRQSGTLRVVMSSGSAPFALADADADSLRQLTQPDPSPSAPTSDGRKLAGLDVDMALLLANELGAKLVINLVPRFDLVFETLGKGDADCALAGITRTVARAASLSFSQPYIVSGQEIMVRDDARFPTLDAVKKAGVRVGAKRGTTSESFAKSTLAPAEVVPLGTTKELFGALDEGRIDAAVADGFIGRDAVAQKMVHSKLFSVERRRFTSESIAIAMRQGDPDWTAYVSLVIRESKADGTFQKLAHRYNTWLRTER